jgi:hypothetical protein
LPDEIEFPFGMSWIPLEVWFSGWWRRVGGLSKHREVVSEASRRRGLR